MSVRVLIVDDEPLIRSGIKHILEGDPDIEVVSEASDGQDGVGQARELSPDVVLMDIRMPRVDGIQATRLLQSMEHPPVVVMLTSFDTEEFVLDSIDAGASGFLLKTSGPQELVSAVRSAAHGSAPLNAGILKTLVQQQHGKTRKKRNQASRLASLSERERDVADLVAKGLSNTEIAQQLFVSLTTVKTHMARIFDKLAAENRVQVAITVLNDA